MNSNFFLSSFGFQIKVDVKAQQEKSDEKLKNLHQDMVVVKKPTPTKKKADKKKKATPAAPAKTRPVREKLNRMQVN